MAKKEEEEEEQYERERRRDALTHTERENNHWTRDVLNDK